MTGAIGPLRPVRSVAPGDVRAGNGTLRAWADLTADGGRMLEVRIALTSTRPTQPVVGGDTTPPSVPAGLAVTPAGQCPELPVYAS